MSDSEEKWHSAHPEGLAEALLALTIMFSITTLAVLALRAYIRTVNKLNSLEDYLMYIGGILNIAHNAVVAYGCFTGIGTRDAKLNIPIMMEAGKTMTIWQLFYVIGSPFIKVSICTTLIRVAAQRRYTYPLYAVVILSIAMTIMAVIIVFIQCVPFQAIWTGDGKCISTDIIIIPTYIFSATNILVDWTVSILPAFFLWHLQLRRKLKMICFGILGVGIFASIATIIRMPYVQGYAATTDKIYKVGFVILWTVVELGLGVIAGSLPSLRKLFKSLSKDHSTGDQASYGTDLVTIGGNNRSKNRNRVTPGAPYDCELNTTVGAGREGSSDGAQDKDDDSTRRIIQVTRDVTQTYV
ncbi:hypothetical protein EDB81DRAFT_875786 [Dactylonectria macrodidyma]|uniref:Rhodopsin domain-containing protein n=1 Tax=Dactylonectria macrodidyma TaxID=307937 RepID=A0A9P9FW03_9HYPO|nr:hypothetical protein EDB81DRAFT_875786 [Dactylonectria macrodidyma]